MEKIDQKEIHIYPHQKNNITMMESFEKQQSIFVQHTLVETNLAILCDPPGTGKTRAMVGVIQRDKMMWDMKKKFALHYTYKNASPVYLNVVKMHEYDRLHITVIITEKSNMDKWMYELSLTRLNVYQCRRNRQNMWNTVNMTDYDVVLLNQTTFNSFALYYSDVAIKRIVYDEPGMIHVPNMKPLVCGFMWLISNSPSNIRHNRSGFMNLITSGYYYIYHSYLCIFNTTEQLKKSWTPRQIYYKHHVYRENDDNLHSSVRDEIIELSKKGEHDRILNLLGGKIICTDGKSDIKDRCSICISDIKHPIQVPCCRQYYCSYCLLQWCINVKLQCPLCRSEVTYSSLIYPLDDAKPKQVYKTKAHVIMNILQHDAKKNVLVFDNFNLHALCDTLNQHNILYATCLAMYTTKRIKQFNNPLHPLKVALVQPGASFSGINFTMISDVIICNSVLDSPEKVEFIKNKVNNLARTFDLVFHCLLREF